jgi:hypothetical protein
VIDLMTFVLFVITAFVVKVKFGVLAGLAVATMAAIWAITRVVFDGDTHES